MREMRYSRILVASAVCILLGVLAGCGGREEPGAGRGGEAGRRIAVIPKGTTHEFWKSVHAGAEKAARELRVEVVWQGPLKEDDREAQIRTMEDVINAGVSAICLAPLDDTALQAPVATAKRKNIPVVIFDSDLKGEDYVSFVATDNFRGGQMAAREMVRLLEGRGKVIVLRYQEGSASTFNRERGFLEEIARHDGVEIISANQYGGATRETAFKQSENLLAPLKGSDRKLTVDGIFTPNESTTFGMLRALQDAKLGGTVKFVGFDTAPELVDALRKGHIHGLIAQDPMRMGYLAVKTMVEHLDGADVNKRIDTGAHLITRENMEEPDIRDLLNPPLSEYLD